MVFEDGAQELGDGKNVLGMADLFEDVGIEPFGKQEDAFLLAGGAKEPAFTGIGKDRLVAAAAAGETGETSMKVSTLQVVAQDLPMTGRQKPYCCW